MNIRPNLNDPQGDVESAGRRGGGHCNSLLLRNRRTVQSVPGASKERVRGGVFFLHRRDNVRHMTRAARSSFLFGIYLGLLGVGLVIAPNVVLGIFGVPPTSEVWIRVTGMLTLLLGCNYVLSARANNTFWFKTSVPLRCTVIVFFGAFVFAGLAPPILILFGAIDLVTAAWTWAALRRDVSSGVRTSVPA
jgi:hypothetical protein